MEYTMTRPCDKCPFLKSMARGFTLTRLKEFASGAFPCHQTAEYQDATDDEDGGFKATATSLHCAGALIFNEKRGQSTQMMRICERLGFYDASKLDMTAKVR